MKSNELLSGIADTAAGEVYDTLLETESFKLERIVSNGQCTPEGEWLQESTNEWVLLLSGMADLLFEGDEEPLRLKPGDYVHIPANRRHSVVRTDSEAKTVWIALHYRSKVFVRDDVGKLVTSVLLATDG